MAAGSWIRATRVIGCVSIGCARSMARDEAVYLLAGHHPVCQPCALERAGQTPPADLPHLAPVIDKPAIPTRLPLSDSTEPTARYTTDAWGSVATKAKGELARMRRQLAAANANDGKLRQVGAD